jgi:hypothetical protein
LSRATGHNSIRNPESIWHVPDLCTDLTVVVYAVYAAHVRFRRQLFDVIRYLPVVPHCHLSAYISVSFLLVPSPCKAPLGKMSRQDNLALILILNEAFDELEEDAGVVSESVVGIVSVPDGLVPIDTLNKELLTP